MYIWNKAKFEFSIVNSDTLKKFSEAEDRMWNDLKAYEADHAPEGKLDADGIAKECEIIDAFFDGLFGQGTSKEMFKREHDLGERVRATKKLYNIRNSQLADYEKGLGDLWNLAKGEE